MKSPVPETSDSTLGFNSSKTTGHSNPEQAKQIQELDTVDLVSVRNVDIVPEDQIPTTSTQLEPSSVCLDIDFNSFETETDTASALSAIQYQNLDDIGKWTEHIDDGMRLHHIIQQGQEVVQQINTNFAEASTVT